MWKQGNKKYWDNRKLDSGQESVSTDNRHLIRMEVMKHATPFRMLIQYLSAAKDVSLFVSKFDNAYYAKNCIQVFLYRGYH